MDGRCGGGAGGSGSLSGRGFNLLHRSVWDDISKNIQKFHQPIKVLNWESEEEGPGGDVLVVLVLVVGGYCLSCVD